MLSWGKLTDIINNEKGLDFNSILFFVFSDEYTQLFTIELNTGSPNNKEYGQLFLNGEDTRGAKLSELGGEYSDQTIERKQFEGLPFDRVTLYNEGDFYKSWNFKQNTTGFTLEADTIKEGEDLQSRWGFDLIGLTDESIEILGLEIANDVIQHILSTLLQ